MSAPTLKLTSSVTTNSATTYTVKMTLKLYGNGESWNADACKWTIKQGSTTKSGTHSFTTSTSAQTLGSARFSFSKGTSSATKSFSATFATGGYYGTIKCSASVTVPALETYKITYGANGGTGAPSAQTKYHGIDITLSTTRPTRTGYTFVRWNTNTSNTGTAYAPGATYTKNAALTLYAIWQAVTYAVSYNANGGTGAPASQTKTYGVNLTLSSTKPTRTGYTFLRWNTKADGTGTNYSSGAVYSANAAVTLYAQWEVAEYSITYNINGGTGTVPASQLHLTPNSSVTLASTSGISKQYKTCLGWATSASATEATYASEAVIKITSNLTLYAVWAAKKVTVNLWYIDKYTVARKTEEADQGTDYSLPSSLPSNDYDNYKFTGYYELITSTPTALGDFKKTDLYMGDDYSQFVTSTGVISETVTELNYAATYKINASKVGMTSYSESVFLRSSASNLKILSGDVSSTLSYLQTILMTDNGESTFASLEDEEGTWLIGYVKYTSPYTSSEELKNFNGEKILLKGLHSVSAANIDTVYENLAVVSILQSGTSTVIAENIYQQTVVFKDNFVYLLCLTSSGILSTSYSYVVSVSAPDTSYNAYNDYNILTTAIADVRIPVQSLYLIADVNSNGSMVSIGGKAVDDVSTLPVITPIGAGSFTTPAYSETGPTAESADGTPVNALYNIKSTYRYIGQKISFTWTGQAFSANYANWWGSGTVGGITYGTPVLETVLLDTPDNASYVSYSYDGIDTITFTACGIADFAGVNTRITCSISYIPTVVTFADTIPTNAMAVYLPLYVTDDESNLKLAVSLGRLEDEMVMSEDTISKWKTILGYN